MPFRSVCIALSLMFAAAPALAQEPPPVQGEFAVGEAFPGSFFAAPAGQGPHPTIILLGGSEGNDISARRLAPLFLAEGYAVFGLIYYSPQYFGAPQAMFPGLPQAFSAIPVEQAGKAKAWLARRPDIRSDAIALYGVSKGAEFALLAGERIDGFAAIAAIVPSDVVWEGWGPGTTPGETSSFSWNGEPLPFVPYVDMQAEIAKYGTDETPRLRTPQDAGRHANPDRVPAARIRVEMIDEPVFVAGGDQDNTWASGEMAQAIAERRAEAGLETVSLIFPEAGHGLSGEPRPNRWSSEADLAAKRIIWPATLAFFRNHLKSGNSPGGGRMAESR